MSLVKLIPLAIQISLMLISLCVGLNASGRAVLDLLRKPDLLLRSLWVMNVIMPLFVVAAAVSFELNHALLIALVALAVSPVPPLLPKKEFAAGGTPSYVVGLLFISGLLSIIIVPGTIEILGRLAGRPAHVSAGNIAAAVGTSMLLPLVLGFAVRRYAPSFSDRAAGPLSIAGTILLVVAAVPILIGSWHAITALIGNFTLVAIVIFVLFGLLVGHLLGGPNPDDRTVLALSTVSRHPGVALAIAHASAPDNKQVPAAVLLVLIVSAIVSLPYVKWRSHTHSLEAPQHGNA